MLDVITFLAFLVPMPPPPTWAPSAFLPTVSHSAWSSENLDTFFDFSEVEMLDGAMLEDSVYVSGGNTSFFISSPNEIDIILKKLMYRNDILSQLDGFSALPADWGGDDTVSPSRRTIATAKALIASLSSEHALPQVSPSVDGEIGFTWFFADRRIEALLYPDNLLVWLWSAGGAITPGGEETFTGSVPDMLSDLITDSV